MPELAPTAGQFDAVLGVGRGGGIRALVSDEPFLYLSRRERLQLLAENVTFVLDEQPPLGANDIYALIGRQYNMAEFSTLLCGTAATGTACQQLIHELRNRGVDITHLVFLDRVEDVCVQRLAVENHCPVLGEIPLLSTPQQPLAAAWEHESS